MRLTAALAALVLTQTLATAQQQSYLVKLLPEDPASYNFFGRSVAISGGTALVGLSGNVTTDGNVGAAYLFDALAGQQLAVLQPSGGAAVDLFGWSVDISGDTAVVSAHFDSTNFYRAGAAYLFDVTTGQELFKLLPNDPAESQSFGTSVAIDGNYICVGATGDQENGQGSGAVYVFDATTGQQLQKLTASDAGPSADFGRSVDIDGDLLLVGASIEGSAGSAYLFDLVTGLELFKLTASDGVSADYFGHSVGISGGRAVVGAKGHSGHGVRSGAAYLFDTATGIELAKLEASDAHQEDSFGEAVAISGNMVIVGASQDDDNDQNSGSAYFFHALTGEQVAKLLPIDGQKNDWFGSSVAISDGLAMAGATGDDAGAWLAGSSYVFDAADYNTGSAYCFGDGSGAACPCGASGGSGEGCLNGSGAFGAIMVAAGNARLDNDNFRLHISGVPGPRPGLILRGISQQAGGFGVPLGDGLFCTTGQTARSQIQIAHAGSTTFLDFKADAFGLSSYGAGVTTNYQFWYRDPANACSGSKFNFSNAWSVTWEQ